MELPGKAGIIAWALKNILWLILGVVVAIAIGFIFYRVFVAPGEAKRELAVAHGQTVLSNANAAAGGAAVDIVSKNADAESGNSKKTRDNHAVITHAPGASVVVSDDVDHAARAAICVRKSAAGLPECRGLLEAHP